MKTVILAGGRGTRLQELTGEIPKPMVEIGGVPILQHIMGIYAKAGFTDFIVAGGYKLEVINTWLKGANLPWNINLVDTGIDTTTGGRIKKLEKRLSETFMLTYGDGVSDIDISKLLAYHNKHQSYITVTAVHPPARFGLLKLEGDYVIEFSEKSVPDGWINGGFFVCEPEVLSYIREDESFENGPLYRLCNSHLWTGYRHEGYWHCMDTMRDVEDLREQCAKGAPWK